MKKNHNFTPNLLKSFNVSTSMEKIAYETVLPRCFYRIAELKSQLFAQAVIYNPYPCRKKAHAFQIELFIYDNEEDKLQDHVQNTIRFEPHQPESEMIFQFNWGGEEFKEGFYYIDVYLENDFIGRIPYCVQNVSENYTDYFHVQKSFVWDESPSVSKTIFNLEATDSLHFSMFGENKHLKVDPIFSEFHICLFNNKTGLLKTWQADFCALTKDVETFHLMVSFDAEKAFWEEGEYRIDLLFAEQVICSNSFEIRLIKECTDKYNPNYHSDDVPKMVTATLSDPMTEINNLVGLQMLKDQLKNYLDRVAYEKIRKEQGYQTSPLNMHSIFLGPPGTGKTTVAELLGKTFRQMGLLSKGHVVSVERSILSSPVYGGEEKNTREALECAQGGILFVDEAYNLFQSNDLKDPGRRTLETLMTTLSDETNRDLVVILAGYSNPMENMLLSNPGLYSRFPNIYTFDSFSPDELMQIALAHLSKQGFAITNEGFFALQANIEYAYNAHDPNFGNARYVKNLLDNEIITSLASRIIRSGNITSEALNLITIEDIPKPNYRNLSEIQQVGFRRPLI